MSGQLLLLIWVAGAVAIWAWAWLSSDASQGDGEAVFLAIVCGAGLAWPIVLAVLLLGFIVYRWRRARRPARSWA